MWLKDKDLPREVRPCCTEGSHKPLSSFGALQQVDRRGDGAAQELMRLLRDGEDKAKEDQVDEQASASDVEAFLPRSLRFPPIHHACCGQSGLVLASDMPKLHFFPVLVDRPSSPFL